MIEPFDWNVVVAGAWNRALLTPAWLQKRVFEAPEAIVELSVPLEFAAPPRVKLGDTAIEVANGALVVSAVACTYETLAKAQGLAKKALVALPETPIAGVGINIRYRLGELAQATLDRTKAEFDDRLGDAHFVAKAKTLQRSLESQPGLLNLTLSEDEGSRGEVIFNFHLGTADVTAAKTWLELTTERLKGEVDRLLIDCIGIEEGQVHAN